MPLSVIILAAGQGKRMRSQQPKVLHKIGARSLLGHVLACVEQLKPEHIYVVHGHGGEQVQQAFPDPRIIWVHQAEQLGTGHAVQQALHAKIPADHQLLVLYADVPLITATTLQQLLTETWGDSLGLLTMAVENPTGYGRILRGQDAQVLGIVEEKDATAEQKSIREINTGIVSGSTKIIHELLAQIDNKNAQGEYYLTDIFALAARCSIDIKTCQPKTAWEVQGVNSREQLAELERIYQQQQALQLMEQGVSLRDPARLDVRGELHAEADVEIDINCVFEGICYLGSNTRIGPNCVIKNSRIGANVVIESHTVIENAVIADHCTLGPFARIRPATELAEGVRIGNFVETKNAKIAAHSKVNHLSYVGDAIVGQRVNIGAGTITCNYDGANKHLTEIADDVFVGSDCQLIAPVKIGQGATLGAGSTITRDVESAALALTRAPQKIISGWQRPKKKSSEK